MWFYSDLHPFGEDKGVEQEWGFPQRVLHCRVLQSRFAPPPLCGEDISRGSRFSASFWGKIAEHRVLLEGISEVPDT